jgi:hypothetical protein
MMIIILWYKQVTQPGPVASMHQAWLPWLLGVFCMVPAKVEETFQHQAYNSVSCL